MKNKMQGIPPLHRKLIVELGDAVKYLGEVGSKISTSGPTGKGCVGRDHKISRLSSWQNILVRSGWQRIKVVGPAGEIAKE